MLLLSVTHTVRIVFVTNTGKPSIGRGFYGVLFAVYSAKYLPRDMANGNESRDKGILCPIE